MSTFYFCFSSGSFFFFWCVQCFCLFSLAFFPVNISKGNIFGFADLNSFILLNDFGGFMLFLWFGILSMNISDS